jgi:Tfp pilus assembly protein PilF
LLSYFSFLVFLLLTVGGVWATRDLWKEQRDKDQRRTVERNTPFAVRAEQEARVKLAEARAPDDRRAEGAALANVGFWLYAQELYAEAEPVLKEALAINRATGNRFLEERGLTQLAWCAKARGQLDEAEVLLRESLSGLAQVMRGQQAKGARRVALI